MLRNTKHWFVPGRTDCALEREGLRERERERDPSSLVRDVEVGQSLGTLMRSALIGWEELSPHRRGEIKLAVGDRGSHRCVTP